MHVYKERAAEIIMYKEEEYRRYPDSKEASTRNYYTKYVGRGRRIALHVVIYKDNFGEIPEGYHVHHKDGNPLNNNPSNFECLDGREHSRRHSKETYESNKAKGIDNLCGGSLKFKDVSVNKGKEAFKRREPIKCICKICGEEYSTKFYSKPSFFCSGICKSKHRRDSKVDMEDRVCHICGNVFNTNKYKKSKTCSNSCANHLRWEKRRQVVI